MVPAITQKELEQYLLQSLNMALGSVLQGETSYTNSFDISVKENGFIFIPRLPSGFVILPTIHATKTKFCLLYCTENKRYSYSTWAVFSLAERYF